MAYTAPDFRTALDMDMASKGMNERELGRMLGLSQQSVSKWRHRNFPPLYRVDELKKIFGPDSQIARFDFSRLALETPKLRVSVPSGIHSNAPAFSRAEEKIEDANGPDRVRAWRDQERAAFVQNLAPDLRKNLAPTPSAYLEPDYGTTKLALNLLFASRGAFTIPEVVTDRAMRLLPVRKASGENTRLAVAIVRGKFPALNNDMAQVRWGIAVNRIRELFDTLGIELWIVDSGKEVAQRVCEAEGVLYSVDLSNGPEPYAEDDVF